MKVLFVLGLALVLGYTFFAKTSDIVDIKVPQVITKTFLPAPSPKPVQTTLLLTGDIMLGRSVMAASLDNNDPLYPFRNVADELKAADITFANLENPIVSNCQRHLGGFTFCAPPSMIQGLKYAGIDIVTLANNHTLNYSQEGLEETHKLLDQNGILVTGINNLATTQVNDMKFGFLGFDKSQQSHPKLTQEEINLIKESDVKVDILVVGIHWGVEYEDKALPGVRKLAGELVKQGVDIVVGNHPHWVQDYEKVEGKPVYYALGNFVFDQMWSEETKKGLVVKLTFEGSSIVKEEFFNTYIKKIGQPEFVSNN